MLDVVLFLLIGHFVATSFVENAIAIENEHGTLIIQSSVEEDLE